MLHELHSPELSFHASDIGTLMQFLAEKKKSPTDSMHLLERKM